MAEIIDLRVAQERDLICHEGDDFLMEFDVLDDSAEPFSFAGYTAKMQMRARKVETDPVVLEFTVTLTTGNLKVTKANADMAGKSGEYFYDLKLTDNTGFTERWLFGRLSIKPTVTV